MADRKTLGVPYITGNTVDELRQSVQFWMQQVFNHLDTLSGVRGTPTFHASIDTQGNTIDGLPPATQPTQPVTLEQLQQFLPAQSTGESGETA